MKGAFFSIALTTLLACTQQVQTLESTTTEVPNTGGEAISADGRFRVVLQEGALENGETLIINTRRDITVSDARSLLYEVEPKDLSFKIPAEAIMLTDDGAGSPLPHLTLSTVENDVPKPLLSSNHIRSEAKVTATLNDLANNHFALFASDIISPPCVNQGCNTACTTCPSNSPECISTGFCNSAGMCVPEADASCLPIPEIDGWSAPVSQGQVFVINNFRIDDAIQSSNALRPLGGALNDQIRQGLLGGEHLVLLEIAGLEQPYLGQDNNATLKFYSATDADEPPFPANNFQIPPGHTTCCEFRILPQSLANDGQSRSRVPALIDQGWLRTRAPIAWRPLTPQTDPTGALTSLEHARFAFEVPSHLQEIEDGLVFAAVPARNLAAANRSTVSPNWPYQNVLELVVLESGQPDVDLDFDGLEIFEQDSDGRIVRCEDGDGTEIQPLDPEAPGSCAFSPQIADGYSVVMRFSAVAATALGIAPAGG